MKFTFGVTILCLVLMLVLWFQCGQLRSRKAEISRLNQNVLALKDVVRFTTAKNGQLEQNKLSFIVKTGELEKLNKSLADEVKNTKGKVVYIAKTSTSIKHDTTTLVVTVDSTPDGLRTRFSFDTTYSPGNSRKIKGYVQASTGVLEQDEINFTAVTGLKRNSKGDYEIFFRTNYPGMAATNLEGAYIPHNALKDDFKAKRKRLGVGVSIGYSPLSYDLNTKVFEFKNQITAGIGISFKIW